MQQKTENPKTTYIKLRKIHLLQMNTFEIHFNCKRENSFLTSQHLVLQLVGIEHIT